MSPHCVTSAWVPLSASMASPLCSSADSQHEPDQSSGDMVSDLCFYGGDGGSDDDFEGGGEGGGGGRGRQFNKLY